MAIPFQFLWGWNYEPKRYRIHYLLYTFNSFEDEIGGPMTLPSVVADLAFNSFEDETRLLPNGFQERKLRTFNSFEDETSAINTAKPVMCGVFQFLWGWNTLLCDVRGVEEEQLSIPLRMKLFGDHGGEMGKWVAFNSFEDETSSTVAKQLFDDLNFQFLWGWNLRCKNPTIEIPLLALSIPLRMKQICMSRWRY